MVEFDEANDVATATAAIAVEQVFVGVNEKAGLMVRRAADKAPGSGRSRWAAPVANRVFADTPATESVVSVHQGLFESRTACLDPQNTADRAEIPGKDGGRSQKVLAPSSCL
jgi:hypothetical protein